MIKTREFDSFRSRGFTLPAENPLIHCFPHRLGSCGSGCEASQMLTTYIAKLAIFIGITVASLTGAGSMEVSARETAPEVIRPQPYLWRYLAPEWSSPSTNMTTQFKTDFAAPPTLYGMGHRGIDFKSTIGESIKSPVAGTVTEVGRVVYRDVITIQDSKGRLASFEPVCSTLSKGSKVKQGQTIGQTCTPGLAYSWHCSLCVHFSARINSQYISPLLLTGHFKPSVLKPYSN